MYRPRVCRDGPTSPGKEIAKYLKTLTPVMHKMPDRVAPGAAVKGSIIELPPPSAWDAPRTPAPATPSSTP